MTQKKGRKRANPQEHMPDAEHVAAELAKAESMDDFFGKDGIFARLFANTLESMMEEELTDHLGYEPYEAKGRNSGNSRNGYYSKKVRTSEGDTDVRVPRDRNGDYEPKILQRYASNTNELEEKIIGLCAKGMSTRDIQDTLHDLYGVELSAQSISTITDKIWSLVEAWQSRPLDAIYPFVFLDALHIKLRREGKIENTAVYVVLGVDMDGHRDVLGHWIGNGSEGANFWLSVVSDLEARGVEDIFIASVDGLPGFKEAIHSIFPQTQVQRCIIHQIRHSLRYVSWKDRKAFVADLKTIYQAPTLEQATANLHRLGENWGGKYAIAVKSWEKNWDDLTTFFDFPADIRRIIYTTNTVEAYHRQIRRVTKTKSSFPSPEAARKLMKKLAGWADAYYLLMAPHNVAGPVATAAAYHLAATTTNFMIQEYFNDFDASYVNESAPGLPPVVDGYVALPEGPGLGITLDEDVIAAHPTQAMRFNLFQEDWHKRDMTAGAS